MQANRKHIYVYKEAPIYQLSGSKAPKRSKLRVKNTWVKPVDFFDAPKRALALAPATTLLI